MTAVSGRPPGPARPDAATAERWAALLSDADGREHRVVRRLAGGETGAHEIVRMDGLRLVMKWEVDPDRQHLRRVGAEFAERLRTVAAWPAPRQRVVDVDEGIVVIQDFLAGAAVDCMTHAIVDRILDLHHARLGLAGHVDSTPWGADMIGILVEGGNGYCLHAPLREFGRSIPVGALDGYDIVHGDLHPGNLLQRDGRPVAIVDLDFCRAGDAAFDLTMMALGSLGIRADPGVRSRLFDLGVHGVAEARRWAYVANILLRNLDWAIRKHRRREIEFWLAQVDRLLPA